MSRQLIEEALAEPDPLTRTRRFDELGQHGADTRLGVGIRDGVRWPREDADGAVRLNSDGADGPSGMPVAVPRRHGG
jgi:hypothetical protein